MTVLRPVHPKRVCLTLLIAVAAILVPAASASAAPPEIVNSSSWLESLATAGESDDGGNWVHVSVVVKHDKGQSVDQLVFDDDWDGTTDPTSVKTNFTAQKLNLAGNSDYTRISYAYQIPTGNTGMSCPVIGTRTRRTDNRNLRVRARTGDGQFTATLSNQLKFVATGQCLGSEDFAYVWGWSQSAQQINRGESVTFNYFGDDVDTTGDSDFQGIRYRLRNLNTGGVSGTTVSCPGNGDNAQKSVEISFPNRGRYVVEAELLDGGGCSQNQNGGYWFWIGAVDVNSPEADSPELSFGGLPAGNPARPNLGSSFTVTANVNDTDDSGNGGLVQNIEWDLDENTGNGVNGYEQGETSSPTAGLTLAQRQRTINTNSYSPGVHTIRARVTDNGAMISGDSIARKDAQSFTFRVDTPPVANAQTVTTDAGVAKAITLTSSDVDGDTPTYSITNTPDHGVLSGSGANRTYTPDPDFAGEDEFQFQVSDGFGGTDIETIELRVRPDTTITSGPNGPTNSTTASFDFDAQDGVTFECDFDGLGYQPCTSPAVYSGLAEDDYTFDVRATSSDGIAENVAAHRDFTVDTTEPDTEITAGPAEGSTSATATPTFEFTSTEAGSTFKCSVDGGAWDSCSSPKTLDPLTDGEHTLEVQAIDPAGNADSASATRTWTSDTTAPDTEIVESPPSADNSNSADFEFDSADETATFQCSLDGASFLSCDNPKTYRDLLDGSHTLEVRAVDPVNNADATPAAYTWTVDTTAPDTTIDTNPAAATQDETGDFTFTSSEGGTAFECTVDGSDPVDCDGGSFTTAALEDGQHVFTVAATDAVGNADASVATYTWIVDRIAPSTSLDGGPNGPVNYDDAEFGLDSNEEPNVTYECKSETDSTFGPCTSPVNRADLPEGDYSLEVKATDAAGNTDATPVTRTWKVDLTDPTTSIVTKPSSLSNTRDAAFEFDGSDPGGGPVTFECNLDNAGFQPCAEEDVFPDLTDGLHSLVVRAKDAAGNVDEDVLTEVARTHPWTIDATVPVSTITDGPASRTSSQDADFTFGSDGGVDDERECKLDDGAWEACGTTKSFTGLDEGPHTFRVRAADDALNVETTPASRSWTIDLTAPDSTIDAGPDANTNSTTARFEFSADEPGSTYECKLDAAAWEDCDSGDEYADLTDGAHTFQVRATDDVDNVEGSPATQTWTIDRAAPQTTIDSGPTGTVRSDSAAFTFSSSEAGSTYQCRLDGGVWATCASPRDLTGLGNGNHKLEVRARDAAGNVDDSPADREWTVRRSDAPDTTIVSGPSGTVPTTDASFSFSSSDNEATFECSLDGADFATCPSPQAYTGLSASEHTFRVRAKDPQGTVDATPAARAWTIAIPPPNTPAQGGGDPPAATCKTFKEPAPCQPASLATLLSAKKAKTKSDLTLTAKSGGPELDAVTFTIPKGVTVKAVKKALGKNAGTLTLKNKSGAPVGSVATLKLPKKVKGSAVLYEKSGVRVNLRVGSRPSVTVSGLPAGVTEVVLALKGKSSGLIVTPKKCASLSWSARMGDRSGGSATATKAAQLCKTAGGNR